WDAGTGAHTRAARTERMRGHSMSANTPADISAVTWRRDGDVAVVTLANPPVNGLSDRVRAGLASALADIEAADDLAGVVLVGEGRGFCGGADVRQFNTPAASAEPGLRD